MGQIDWPRSIPSVRLRGHGPPAGARESATSPHRYRRGSSAGSLLHRVAIAAAVVLLVIPPLFAQQSASHKLTDSVLNAGGHPVNGTAMTSTSFRLRLDGIGDPLVSDLLTSASFRADAGFISGYPPPGQVFGLAFTDHATLRWSPEKSVGSYDLYRDALSSLPAGGYGTCLQHDLPSETTTDTGTPSIGSGWFYLVTAQNRLDEEGTKGTNGAGAERPNPAPCP